MDLSTDPGREMGLLEHIESDPNITQASLAAQLGVAVGTINWHLKRLIAKGYVKVKRVERRKLKYIITPEGIAFRARLTVDYIEHSMLLFRNTRKRVLELLEDVRAQGGQCVVIEGEGDIAEICRLSCLEQGLAIASSRADERMPVLVVDGVSVTLKLAGAAAGV